MRRLGLLLAPLLLVACESQTSDTPETETATTSDGAEWSNIGFDAKEQRHSPLTQINEENVDKLGIAWFKDLPDARGQEATPVIVDGKLYISTAWSKVFAYDAKTGEELWSYDPEVPGEKAVDACCDVVNRGVAINRGKLFFGTIDGRLIALDANTGARLWETQTTDNSKPYTITGAPRVVKNMVIIGNGGAEFGVRGYLSAYDVSDGSMNWRFYTTPNPEGKTDGAASDEIFEKAANKTWGDGNWRESGGGGTVWDSIVYDEDLDQLYFGVGNGNPWNHSVRSGGEGDNLFLSSIVAVDPDTGEYLWHFQETPAENWDYTATQHIIQAELEIDGKARKVLYHAPKNGFFFVIDRVDGTLLSAEPFVEGINWAEGYDLETGRPIEKPEARYNKTGEPFIAIPGALGAHNWHPMSYNPKTGLVYIPAQQIPQGYLNPATSSDKDRERLGFNVGISWAIGQLPDDKAAFKAAIAATTGKLVAFNPKTGKVQWSQDHPSAWNGGTMTTASNLVFQGTATGKFKAYTADAGKELLSLDMQSGIVSAPSTYIVDGEQYVAFLTSKGGAFPLVAGVAGGASRMIPNIPRLVVLKVGGTGKLPDLPAKSEVVWDPPEQTGTPEQVALGKELFGRNCVVCHGDSAIGNGFTPDLRISGALTTAEGWKTIVGDGALKDRGMVGFGSQVNAEGIEAMRHYVIERSHWTKENIADIGAPVAR